MNVKWVVDKGVIKGITDDRQMYPRAKELLLAGDSIIVDGIQFPFSLEDYRIFKLIPIRYSITIFFNKGNKIGLNVVANKGVCSEIVNNIDGHFLDYCVFDKSVYYLEESINDLNDLITNMHLDITNISFSDYISICKYAVEKSLPLNDLIKDNLSKIQRQTCYTNESILFPYQQSGVNWLNYMFDNRCGCILADSMGLGKTLQIIYLLAHIKDSGSDRHSLVVAPVSLLENWRREIAKFYPSLSCYVNYGKDKINYYKDLLNYDVIVDSYSGVQSGFGMYQMIEWDSIILDEAQNIKNPYAKRTKTIKELYKHFGVAVTGTPFENHVLDIWSLTDFVIPNYFGTMGQFERNYEDDIDSAIDIEKRLSPIMIRRKVGEVAKDLPERVDIPQPIKMTESEALCYDSQLRDVAELKILAIEKIQRLRMFCTHPSVYNNDYSDTDPYMISEKYQRCCEIIDEIVANKEKVIIFTSFNEMINVFLRDLPKRFNVYVDYINGSIEAKQRQIIIDNFSEIEGAAVLVLNPKAAGAGLNITAANHVIHYNLEWNPSIEDQASARAYRRGQNKTVFVHRLYYTNTIEEVINERIEKKRAISNIAIVGNNGEIDAIDLARALSLSPLSD